MDEPRTGIFIVFEGPEGAGKSTQVRLLAHRLRGAGLRVVESREPGGTPIGEQVRRVLLDHANVAMRAETEALLYSAARAQHVAEVLRPALAEGAVVVCDRFVDSTLAYQGGGHGLPLETLRTVQRLATGDLLPDLRVLLDVPVEIGLSRRFGSPDDVNRIDAADVAFHRRVRAAFRELAADDRDHWVVIDAAGEVEDVSRRVADAVHSRLGLSLPASVDGVDEPRVEARAGDAGPAAGARS